MTGAPRRPRDARPGGAQRVLFARPEGTYFLCPRTLECGTLAAGGEATAHLAAWAGDFRLPAPRRPLGIPDQDQPRGLGLRHLVLAVSGRCNLDCPWCRVGGRPLGMPETDMTVATGLAALELGRRHQAPGQGLVVSFYGGEPLLNREVIAAVLAASEEWGGGRLRFWLCTNGTLYDEELCARLIERDGTVLLSLGLLPEDGEGEPAARLVAPEVLANLHRLVARWPDRVACVVVGAGSQTLSQGLWERLPQVVRERLVLRPWLPLDGAARGRDGAARRQAETFSRAQRARLLARRLPPPLTGIALDDGCERWLGRLFWRDRSPWHCGAAGGEILVAADGTLLPCAFFAGCPVFALGRVENGPDPERLGAYFRAVARSRREACAACWALPLCQGGCPRRHVDLGGHWHRRAPAYCDDVRDAVERAVVRYASASRDGSLLYLMGLR